MSSVENAPPGYNYAHAEGIHSLAAAIVFAVLYALLFPYFLRNAIRRPTYVFIVLSFFCVLRITAFVMRSVMAGSETAGQNLSLLIADSIIYSVGFFGLLYSAYTLVLDRELLLGFPTHGGILYQFCHSRRLYRLCLTIAVAIGITGTELTFDSTNSSTISTGQSLRKASTIIFLALTVLLAFQTIMLARAERSVQTEKQGEASVGSKYGSFAIIAICILLIIREAFLAATVGDLKTQDNEHFWYPLVVLTEFIAVCCFATPGLVPPRAELPK